MKTDPKTGCKACGGTGKNSNGNPCYPCQQNGRLKSLTHKALGTTLTPLEDYPLPEGIFPVRDKPLIAVKTRKPLTELNTITMHADKTGRGRLDPPGDSASEGCSPSPLGHPPVGGASDPLIKPVSAGNITAPVVAVPPMAEKLTAPFEPFERQPPGNIYEAMNEF